MKGGEIGRGATGTYTSISPNLTDKINQYNNVLTDWIQMRQGSLSLRIESFPLQPAFRYCCQGKDEFPDAGGET